MVGVVTALAEYSTPRESASRSSDLLKLKKSIPTPAWAMPAYLRNVLESMDPGPTRVGQTGPCCTVGAVTRGDVADLMSHHAGQFGFVVEVGQYPPGQVNIPAGHGESIDDRAVQHLDGIGQIRLVTESAQPFSRR